MINIGLCTDENYAMACGVCITSIFENNKNNSICIHLLSEDLKDNSIQKLKGLANRYQQQIEFYNIDSIAFEGLPISDRYRKSIYFRLLYPTLLPESVDRLLYMDCDTIILKDLSQLMNTDLNGYVCGVVEDHFSDDIRNRNRIEQYDDIFNTGVLLMNLKLWRDEDITRKCIQFIHDHSEKCLFPDQDALNIILHHKVLWLDSIYNYQEGFFYKKGELMLHKSKWHKVDRSIDDIVILHYSFTIKPWHKECQHIHKSQFLHYKNISPWKSYPIKFWNNKFLSVCRYYYELFLNSR